MSDSDQTRRRHHREIAQAALQCYTDGADGISTYSWSRRDPTEAVGKDFAPPELCGRANRGCIEVVRNFGAVLNDPKALRDSLPD